jgi:hypothetical protein
MEPEVATLLYAASDIGSSREPIAIPSADTPPSWAIYVANMYKNWQFWEGRTMEFEVLARMEAHSRVWQPYVESTREVLIGSPVFVAQT